MADFGGDNPALLPNKYDKITRTEQLRLFDRPWPVWLTTETARVYTLSEGTVDREAAEARLEQALLFRLEQLMRDSRGEVLRTDFSVREEGGRLTVTLLAECREEIGRTVERPGETGRRPGGAE